MLDVSELRKAFYEKLAATDSLDAAFTKAVWLAFKAGLAAGAQRGQELAEPKGGAG